MNASKHVFALLLALCLIVSMVVPAVHAEGSKEVNITVNPVTGEIAAKDAVTSVNCLLAATDEFNGHDYVYLFFNGGMMYVYDLDQDAIIDIKSNCFGTPRSVYIDSNHIVWVTGANGKLYRYDPANKFGNMISMTSGLFSEIKGSFNGYGLTGDGQGNLYFGTYPAAYVAKYDTKTGKFSQLGGLLSAPGQNPDATRSGEGGLIYKDGYLYFEIEGNLNGDATSVNQIVKFDLSTNTVVDYVDILGPMNGYAYLDEIALVGDLLLCSSAKATVGSIAIDISGEKMELISNISGLTTGFNGAVSPEVNGKVYMMSNNQRGLLEYDIAQQKVTAENVMSDKGALKFRDCFVTLEGNDQMPGKSLVTFVTGVNNVDLVLYNLQTKNTVVLEDVTEGQGSGNQLRALETINNGNTILVSSYGWNHMSVYDLESGKVIKQHPTINTQIESMIYYEDEVYIGNYSSCTVSRIDVETGKYVRLVQLGNSVFSQHRLHATAAGDGKVFFGTAPAKYRLGGVLIWYDVESDRCYVAAGPNPEDVFYTPSGASKGGETGTVSNQQWYSALTGELALTDADDPYISATEQRFYGLIHSQTINSLVYQDGYIYGSTSRSGGSQSDNTSVGNACLFVYDAEAMTVVATCDLTEEIDGLTTNVPVEFIDGIEADPDVPGKFWGVVSDTLFSFTYDAENGISVTTELSKGTTGYNHGNNLHQDRSIVMDGDFMYVAFGSYGTYMIKRDDPQVHYKLSDAIPKQMVLAADGNLYYHDGTVDLKVLKIAETAQKVKDAYGIMKPPDMIYDFSTKNHGISGSITLTNANLLANLNTAYADPNGTLNWNYKDRAYAAANADAWFPSHEYFRSRGVANGDWIAFTVDSPGAGSWKLTVANHACTRGVAKVNVYLLPGNTTDIGAALTQENLVGDYTCYDQAVTADTPSIAGNNMNIKTTEFADLWIAGNDETHILVLQVAEASSTASYLYLSSLYMTRQSEVTGTTMTLGNSLSMDFVVETADVEDGYYAQITRGTETVVLPKSQWKTYDQAHLYFSYTGIAAKEMCEQVTVQIFDSTGKQVFETYTDSIRSYAMRMLERADVIADEKLRTLYVDMLNYGAEAQKYWHYNKNDLANAQLTSQQKGYATANVTTHNNQTAGAGYLGAALTLENQILLDFVFQGMDYQNFTAVVSYTDHYGNEKTASIPGSAFKVYQTGASYYVSVDTLVVADWQQVVTCTVKNGETVVASVSDSIESYIHRQLEKETLTDIVGAIAKFGQSANAYFHQKKE